MTPPSEFDGVEAEAGGEDDHQETDSEVASTVRTTPVLDSNKSASEDDSGFATPTPKGRQTKQSRKMQRHSENRDVFDGDVRIPASPSKQRRPKVVVDSEDEPPPMARHRKRPVTPSADSDVAEEVEAASEGSNESDEGDFWDNVQSPGPRVPITPHRGVVSDDEDEAESTRSDSHREKPFIFSKVQTHSVPTRPRSTNRRKRGAPSKHGLRNLKPDDDVEAPGPILAQESSSSSRVLAARRPKRSQVASWIRQRNTLQSEEVGRRPDKEIHALKRKQRSFELDDSNDDGELPSYARRPGQTVVPSRRRKKNLLQEPLYKKAPIGAEVIASLDEESSPPPSPPPVKKTKKKHNRAK